jgi:hypothetical protein
MSMTTEQDEAVFADLPAGVPDLQDQGPVARVMPVRIKH